MDAHHFDTLIRALGTSPSRRNLVRTVSGLWLAAGALPLANAEANRRRRKRRRRKKRRKDRGHVCQGRDACIEGVNAQCGDDPNCFCFVDAAGGPICAKGNTVTICEQCEQQFPGRLCLPGTGPQCGAFGCVEECPL